MKTNAVKVALLAMLSTQLPLSAFAESTIINTGTINNRGIINNGTIAFQFNDIQANNWAFEAVSGMSQRNVITGYEDGTFRPDNPISREELAKMLATTFSLDLSVTDAVYFSDVTPTRWSFPHIAVTSDYITAYYPPKGQPFFEPTANATREDVATALVKITGLNTDRYSSHFTDEDRISPGLTKYVDVAADHKLISGYPDGTFRPSNPITRAEVASLLYRAIKGIKDNNASPSTAPSSGQTSQSNTGNKDTAAVPDLWADVVQEDNLPGEPITVLLKGETTPHATITVNGEGIPVDTRGKFQLTLPVTKDGTLNFEIKASLSGQITTINKSVTITLPAPKLTLEDPSPNYVSFNTGLNIWFDWIDRSDTNPSLYVNGQKRTYLRGGGAANGGYNGSFEVSLQSGENRFDIKLINRYGKESDSVTKVVYYQHKN